MTVEVPLGGFRCPFEIKAEEEGTIVELTLGDKNRDWRIDAISKAYGIFMERPDAVALRIRLPNSLKAKCASLTELQKAVAPYQAEVIAAELDRRLRPFLPYQMLNRSEDEAIEIGMQEPLRRYYAGAMTAALESRRHKTLGKIADIAEGVESWIRESIQKGEIDPRWEISDKKLEGRAITITHGSALFAADRIDMTNRATNRNCFGIVKSPYYPKTFGRYSDDIEIVLTREADNRSVPKGAAEKIRHRSNTVLQNYGVPIENTRKTLQHSGVWIPPEKV